jgi:hypothetical protein
MALLEDSDIKKVGVNIKGTSSLLGAHYHVLTYEFVVQ